MGGLEKGAIAKRPDTVVDNYLVIFKSRTNAGRNPFAERNISDN